MRFRIALLSVLAVLALVSCKKDTEKVYMDGTLKVTHNIPPYVAPGAQYVLSASGIEAPDGTAVGYCFQDPSTKKYDTLSVYTMTAPEKLGSYAVYCYAFPIESSDKYYSSSTSVSFEVVGEESVSGIPAYPGDSKVSMYSRSYPVFTAGGLQWTGSNLCHIERNAAGEEVFGHSYADSPVMQNILGAYYTWEEAKKACPAGWRLPSDDDWVALLKDAGAPASLEPLQDSPSGAGNLMVKAKFNDAQFWEYYRTVNVLNSTHFSAISAGYASISGRKYNFTGFGSYAAFWTSSESDGQGVYRYIYQEFDNVYCGLADKDFFAASVRCVR